MTRILGIDPGLATIGYGLVDHTAAGVEYLDHGVFETAPKQPEGRRLLLIEDWLYAALPELRPDVIGLERPILKGALAYNGLPLSMAYGIILKVAVGYNLRVLEFPPQVIKKVVSGDRLAKKPAMRHAVRRHLGGRELRGKDDGIDGLAVAITAALRTEGTA